MFAVLLGAAGSGAIFASVSLVLRPKGINGRLMFDTWYRMAGLLKSGNMDLSMVVTHKMKFEQFKEGMEIMRSGDSGKIVLYMD